MINYNLTYIVVHSHTWACIDHEHLTGTSEYGKSMVDPWSVPGVPESTYLKLFSL